MLSQDELLHWYQRLGISSPAQSLISKIRSSQPVRNVQNSKGNVCGRYPSRKMNGTIQFESHRNELSFIYEYEHDSEVFEYYDQPSKIKLAFRNKQQRLIGTWHTPDFFVIRKDSAGWEECKTEEELHHLTEKWPGRYQRNKEGVWICPPGNEYAELLGLYYQVRSSKEINWILQRNLIFLEDYLRSDDLPLINPIETAVIAILQQEQSITLHRLFQLFENKISPDDIYKLIANNRIHVDLEQSLLIDPERVVVYLNKELTIVVDIAPITQPNSYNPTAITYQLSFGATFNWNGKIWKIINFGNNIVSLLGEEDTFLEIPVGIIESLIKDGAICAINNPSNTPVKNFVNELILQAHPNELAEANRKHELVLRFLNGETHFSEENSQRTVRLWTAQYKNALKIYGNGYVGLIPKIRKQGNRGPKVSEEIVRLMEEFIENDYESLKQKRKMEVWAAFSLACDKRGLKPLSYKSFVRAIGKRDKYQETLKRKGSRAAYQRKIFHWTINQHTPRHGDRPFEICHLDHTELDIELICSKTQRNLGRPWVTFLTDAYSRRILAFFLTFDSPSYRSCMMVLRECVHLYNRLPQIIVVDNGKEFNSTYFETLLARYECTKKSRPPAQSRFGSVCERLFGTTNTQFIYNLQGNTQQTRNIRQVTKSTNPKNNAIWTLKLLNEKLSEFAYSIYDSNFHPALQQSPKEAYTKGLIQSGNRPQKYIPYDSSFIIWTLPTTIKGTAKVQPGSGIKINYINYWNDIFNNPQIENTNVNVRYDPYNIGLAYAYVENHWVECLSEYHTILQGHSEKELRIATQEIRLLNQQHSIEYSRNVKRLALFLDQVEQDEKVLLQRLRDKEIYSVTAEKSHDISLINEPHVEPLQASKISTSSVALQVKSTDEMIEEYEEF